MGTPLDPNFHLRNELLRDAQSFCAKLGSPAAILVSGDISFAAHTEEFELALKWFENLCSACGTTLSSLFICPGNHDVSRTIAGRPVVQALHNSIKSNDNLTLDSFLRGLLTDEESARLLYESLDNYNLFAQQFFCDLLPPKRTRAHRKLALNDGSTLELWGLNSTFASSAADKPGNLFVDPASFQITRSDGVVNLVMAHHPPSWLRQERKLEDHLNDVAPIQLFGHLHDSRILPARDFIRVAASAAQPSREEQGWEPGYNVIELEVEGEPTNRRLHVKIHVRVWQSAPGRFRAKMDVTSDVFENKFPLPPWKPVAAAGVFQRPVEDSLGEESESMAPMPSPSSSSALREISIRFHRLSLSQKSAIAGRLGLFENEDLGQPDFERFRRVFLRANERNLISELDDAVKQAEQE